MKAGMAVDGLERGKVAVTPDQCEETSGGEERFSPPCTGSDTGLRDHCVQHNCVLILPRRLRSALFRRGGNALTGSRDRPGSINKSNFRVSRDVVPCSAFLSQHLLTSRLNRPKMTSLPPSQSTRQPMLEISNAIRLQGPFTEHQRSGKSVTAPFSSRSGGTTLA